MEISKADIVKLGETQAVEFKKSLSLQREAMEALCGMINTDYGKGKVVFGVDPNNAILGIESGNLDTAQRSLIALIREKFDPKIICNIQVFLCEGKTLLLVEAERNREIPYHEYDGRAYIREGTSRRQLSFAEKQQLSRRRNRELHNGPWKCDRCGAVVGMLFSMIVDDQGVRKSYKCDCGGQFWPIT
jgi:predicted HTH transcriptional regulator